MSLFGRETARLIRQDPWAILDLFAKEVYALLCGDLPMFQNAPMTITNGANAPAITINQAADSPFPPIQINRGNGQVVNLGGTGGVGSVGGIDLGAITFPGGAAPGSQTQVNATPDPADTAFTLWGVIGAKNPDGTYKVTVYAKDPASSPPIGVLDVTQGLIDPTDTIPAGTPATVLCFPGKLVPNATTRTILAARMQVPVFLGDT